MRLITRQAHFFLSRYLTHTAVDAYYDLYVWMLLSFSRWVCACMAVVWAGGCAEASRACFLL